MKTTVIHHSADMDGIFCREIARKFLPDAELIGWDFADNLLALPEGQIYVLDLPVDKPLGLDFDKDVEPLRWFCDSLVWIDHHKTAIMSHPQKVRGYRIDGVAACRLAWQWFTADHREPEHLALPSKDMFVKRAVSEPLAVRLAGEYDVWACGPDGKLLQDLKEFQHGLRSRKLFEGDWQDLFSVGCVTAELLQNGHLIQSYATGVDASTMKKSFLVDFEGLKFLALNTARCNSLTFASKDIPTTGHDALLGFFFNGTKWTVSMYHAAHRKDLDLSTIAVKHGGGGHKGAAGFVVESLPFLTKL